MWYRYVDDTMAKIHENAVDSFSEHLNSIDQHIQFTSEQEKDGRIPFLDACVSVDRDGSTKTSVEKECFFGAYKDVDLSDLLNLLNWKPKKKVVIRLIFCSFFMRGFLVATLLSRICVLLLKTRVICKLTS